MALIDIREAADTDKGKPFVFNQDGGKDVIAFVGQMPDSEARRIVRKYGKSQTQTKGKERLITLDMEEIRGEHVERAIHALRDTDNFVLTAAGQAIADKLSLLLKEPVVSGQDVCFDGKWTHEVKVYLLGLNALYGFSEFVSVKHADLVAKQKEIEEGKDETSSSSSTSASE